MKLSSSSQASALKLVFWRIHPPKKDPSFLPTPNQTDGLHASGRTNRRHNGRLLHRPDPSPGPRVCSPSNPPMSGTCRWLRCWAPVPANVDEVRTGTPSHDASGHGGAVRRGADGGSQGSLVSLIFLGAGASLRFICRVLFWSGEVH